MAQEQIQEQRLTEQQRLAQSVSQQKLLQAQLTELPVTQLAERIQAEMDDNPALEVSPDDYQDDAAYRDSTESTESADSVDATDSYEQEERQSALDEALQSLGRDDEELPVYQGGASQEEHEDIVYGQSISFYDQLKEQMSMMDMTTVEANIMEYLIGSLDDDGLLRKPLHAIADELAIYHNMDVSE